MAELSTPLGDESGGEREFLTLLRTLYRDHPELWQLRSKDYFNKNKKAKALQTIVDTLKPYKSDFAVEKLKQKMNILRTNFNKCYKAIKKIVRNGQVHQWRYSRTQSMVLQQTAVYQGPSRDSRNSIFLG